MSRTKEELLVECIKQFEHIESVFSLNRLTTTKSLISEITAVLDNKNIFLQVGMRVKIKNEMSKTPMELTLESIEEEKQRIIESEKSGHISNDYAYGWIQACESITNIIHNQGLILERLERKSSQVGNGRVYEQ
jgi:hypothetical protein